MPTGREQLIDAAIQQLERLRMRGRRFVAVSSNAVRPAAESSDSLIAGVADGPARTPAPAAIPSVAVAAFPVSPASQGDPALSSGPLTGSPAGEPGSGAATMAELRSRVSVCLKCPHLAAARTTVVFGVGDIHSPLMFVGEAPGADEDRQGEPFVGKAGELLTRIITTMGMSRETVYIANILKCRPDTPGQSSGNRKPTPEEMRTCLPYLRAQIDLIRPKVIVALGATAVEGLLGKTQGITRLRGHWQTFQDIALMPTFHPAFLLRNQALSEKRKVWEDMLQVLERLGCPISDRQRGYFLKA